MAKKNQDRRIHLEEHLEETREIFVHICTYCSDDHAGRKIKGIRILLKRLPQGINLTLNFVSIVNESSWIPSQLFEHGRWVISDI